jgi:putative ABC transport system permease protein
VLKNYLKIVLRNLRKSKGYAFINISGLAIGMTCCILILLYVSDELSYDGYHRDVGRIYRVHTISAIGPTSRQYAHIPPAILPALTGAIPDIEASARIFSGFDVLHARLSGRNVEIPEVPFVDPGIFKIFSYEFLSGDPASAMANPDSLVITRETAERVFGNTNPIGAALVVLGDRNNRALQVTGVIENIPQNSQFRFNGIIPTTFLRDEQGRPDGWLSSDYFCEVWGYVRLGKGADPRDVEKKIAAVAQSQWGDIYKQRGTTRTYLLQRMRDVHLRSNFEFELGTPGDINTVYMFSAIAFFVLLIACFNFINLSTARSANRAREVGIRKVLGSHRKQLVRQFLSESVAVSLVSLLAGLILVVILFPAFHSLSGKDFHVWRLLSWPALVGLAGIIVLTGVISGSFPAFVLSSFQPINVLKGKFSSASKNPAMRKILVVVQFSISVFMIAGIFVMIRQLDYMKNKDLGFNRDQLVVMPYSGAYGRGEMTKSLDALRTRLLQNPRIVSLSFSVNVPGDQNLGYDVFLPEGAVNNESVRAQNYWIDYDFVKTYGITLAAGRDFSRELATDAGRAVLVNEKAAAAFGWGSGAVGKRITNIPRDKRLGVVVGVIKDFHNDNLKMAIPPSVLSLDPGFFSFISARIQPTDTSETLAFLEKNLGEFSRAVDPNIPFTFRHYFIDDDFRSKYPGEERVRTIFLIFGFLAVFIASLGLFGLASFTLEQRKKEIGVRKVLGASKRNLAVMISREFVSLVLVSDILAWPLAYFVMRRWLQTFAYRIPLQPDVFLISGFMAVLVAGLTICFHTVKAAGANPADSLRSE